MPPASTIRRKGFTLIEILVVVAIFSVTSLVATNIFLVTNQASRRTASDQKLQGDVRFALEAIAREVRFGTIDYDCYDNPNASNASCDPEATAVVDLSATGGKANLLALRDVTGNRIRYKVITVGAEPKLEVCLINIGSDALTKCDDIAAWEVVTPEGVRIVNGDFYINPPQNPFQLKEPASASGSPYLGDVQPTVTIVFKSQQSGNDLVPENISNQTTVVSRSYVR